MLNDIFAVLSSVTFDQFILLVQEHQYLIAVLTPFLTGELTIHIFGVLNGSGDVSLVPTFITFAAILVFDIVVYTSVRAMKRRGDALDRIRRIKIIAQFEKLFRKCEERYSRRPMLLLFAIKIMPMTKITLIFFSLCQRQLSVARFILQDICVTALWGSIIFLPGWLVGKEFLTQEIGRRLSSFILYILLIIAVMILFGDWIDRALMHIIKKVADLLERKK